MHTLDVLLAVHRPRFDRGHGLPDGRVLLHVNGTVHGPVPHRRLVGPVDHVDLDLNCSREDSIAFVLRYGLQTIALTLDNGDTMLIYYYTI